jgi:hypothetical protein
MSIEQVKQSLRNRIAYDQTWLDEDIHEQSVGRALRREDKLRMIEKFESLGCTVMLHAHGLLIDDKYVVAVAANKWKNVGKDKWYWYKDIPDLVNKYFRKVD